MSKNVKNFLSLSGDGKTTKADREKLLEAMTNDELDELIEQAYMPQAKIFYSKFKK